MLVLWMAVTVCLQGVLWFSGGKALALTEAVEQGAARAESYVMGEVRDDLVRKAIRTQHDTLPFWTALALIGDFVVDPMALAVRVAAVATLLSALAALAGRPVRFGSALAHCVTAQGIWVLGLAVRVVMAVALRVPEVETSLALVLPAGTYPAPVWVALCQIDAFALWGWAAMARGGWRRGQANPVTASLACALVALGEAALRISSVLVIGAGMRLMLLPD